jgi:ABC-2 type transport system ATP-binding protein
VPRVGASTQGARSADTSGERPAVLPFGPNAVGLLGVTKRYADVLALDDVSLSIGTGQFIALLGPNGAGKTTAVNLMLGLRRPTSGHAELFGSSPMDRAARSRCGVMLQESGVPQLLSVAEIVRLFRSHYARPLPTDQILGMANLEAKANVRADRLSGGERQRLYFAIAVSGDPEILFLDEPTVGMDVETRHRFYDQLRSFSADGRTVLLTTHYLEEADELADRVVVIDHGRIVIDGTPAEIKALVPGRHLTIRASRALTEGDFAGLPHRGLELTDGAASLLSNDPVAVVQGLIWRDVPMVDLEVTGAALEDAFLALTGRGGST